MVNTILATIKKFQAYKEKEITGTRYVDIFAKEILSYKIYGNTQQVLLPEGYTQLEYIESTGTQYINTGITLDNNSEIDINYEIMSYGTGGAKMFGYSKDSNLTANSFAIANKWAGSLSLVFGYGSQVIQDAAKYTNIGKHNIVFNNKTLYADNELVRIFNNETFTTGNIVIGNINHSDGVAPTFVTVRHREYTFMNNGDIVFNGIPAKRNSDNVIGMYDTVSKTFFTNAGTGTFVAGNEKVPTPTEPIEVKGVGDKTVNLFDKSKSTSSYYTETNTGFTIAVVAGNASSAVTSNFSTICPNLEVGKTYMFIYDTEENAHISLGAYSSANFKNSGVPFVLTEEIYTGQIRAGGGGDGTRDITFSNFMLVEGSVAPTSYIPYGYQIPIKATKDGTTTTTTIYTRLNKVGDYQDVLNSDGTITRNVGMKVLDGTENWRKYASRNDLFLLDSDDAFRPTTPMPIFCTHLRGTSESTATQSQNTIRLTYGDSSFGLYSVVVSNITTLEDLKAWLAAQYANGTPVIVYYPLATPTTETITAPEIELSGTGNYRIEIDTEVDATLKVNYLSV